MSTFDEPQMVISLTGLVVNIALLSVLYLLLQKTAKTGHIRYVLRFAIIWSIGNIGLRWSLAAGSSYDLIRIVSDVVLLLGMVPMTALWTHLAWLIVLDLKDKKDRKLLDNYQLAVYIVAIVLIFVGFATRKGLELMPEPYMIGFQLWFMACLAWSTVRFMGPAYDEAPAIEKRSRTLLAAGSTVMFLLLLIDVLQAFTGGSDLALASGLQFVPMALLSYAFFIKRKFIVAPAIRGTSKGAAALGLGVHLAPGKVYFEADKPSAEGMGTAVDILKAQARRGRPSLVITNKGAAVYRAKRWLEHVPVVRFVSDEWDDASGLDVTSGEELAMVPLMVKEFALEAWDLNKDKSLGSLVIIDGAHVFSKGAGKAGTRALLKGLAKAVRGSDQLRVVLVGDRMALGKMKGLFERYCAPITAT
jgi:hypothetical protein